MPMSPRLLRPRAAGGGFDPRRISGLQAWYDPSDSSTVTLDTGVSVLRDKSGNGRTMTQTIGNAQPATTTLNGRVAMSFDGSNDELVSSYDVPVGAKTMFAVSRVSDAGLRGVLGMVGTQRAFLVYASTFFVGAGNNFTTGFGYSPNTTYVKTGLWGASSRGLRVNAASLLSDTYTGTSGGSVLRIGNAGGSTNAFMLGVVAETLLYDRTLTESECLAIERYLGAKWGIALYAPPAYADADVNAYITAVEAADGGVALETGVRDAINTFITGCKADGIWSAIKASCILMGARTLSGALTPLVGATPTNNNFVSGDYNRKTGLLGNAGTKYLDSGRAGNADGQNDLHSSVYVSVAAGATGCYYGIGAGDLFQSSDVGNNARSRGVISSTSAITTVTGFIGIQRTASDTWGWRFSGTNAAGGTSTSSAAPSANYFLYARNNGGPQLYYGGRMAFYSFGSSLALATLDSRISTLYTAIGAAIP